MNRQKINFFLCRLLLALAGAFCVCSVQATTNYLYVATNGNDAWSGTLAAPNGNLTDGPKASLQGTQIAVRAILTATGYKWPTVVQIADGTYALTNAFTLGLSDSAGTTNPVVYQAAPGASPVFSGGRVITGWTASSNGLWTASVPWATGSNYFEQLFIDGRRATRAITPNTDYYYIQAVDPVLTNQAFAGYAADVAPLGSLNAADLSNATVIVYHTWTTSRLRLSSFNATSNYLTFTSKARYAFLNEGRYQIENISSALNQSGEWFLAQNGTVTYWPLPGEDMNTAQVVAPQNWNLITITGNSTAGSYVQNLTFNGLNFQYGQYVLAPTGDSEGQSESDLPAVITLNGAKNVTFTNCEVAHIGQHAIRFLQGCQSCVVSHSYLHDLGGGGVYIGETNVESNVNNYTISNIVDNCIIRACGRIYASGVGVWIGHSANNKVTHNEISDLYYTGVSVGWMWGYYPSIATNNLIDGNHIHDLGWGMLSDMGGIYTLGISPGTRISQNYVHNVSRYSYGGWGIYNDQGSSGITVVSNLVADTMDGGYQKNNGRTNIIQNNIFACGTTAEMAAGQQDATGISIFFKNNILYWLSGNNLLDGAWSIIANSAFSTNLYWQVSSTNISFITNTFAQWQALGQDAGSKIADPLFMDGANDDFRFASTAAATAIGFHPFSFTNAGVYGDPAWQVKSQQPSQPVSLPEPVSFAPFNFNESFEELNPGAPVSNAGTYGVSGGASVIVTSNTAASGTVCLAVTGAAGLPQSYFPYFTYNPPNSVGNLSFAFSIRLAADSSLTHEWRDYDATGSSYVTGPSFNFIPGQLKVGNQTVNVPSNQWLRVQINVNTTNYVSKGWQLGLTKPGFATQWFTNYPSGSGTNWNQLNWLGFLDHATNTSTFYLDDFNATNFVPAYAAPQPPAPVISGLTNSTIGENSSAGPMAFTVIDPGMPASGLTLTAYSSNQRLVPDGNLALGGSATNRTLAVTPAINQTGVATISVLADDGYFQTTATFQLTVTNVPASPAPGFSPVPGSYSNSIVVTITNVLAGATTYYTTDGSTPATNKGLLATSPITISNTLMLQAISYKTGWLNSSVTAGNFINIPPPPAAIIRIVTTNGTATAPLNWLNPSFTNQTFTLAVATNWLTTNPTNNLLAGNAIGAATVALNATNLALGTYTNSITLTSSDPLQPAQIASVTLLVVSAMNYNYWRTNNFTAAQLTNSVISGDNVAPNPNGVPNLMAYALGLNPFDNLTNGLPVYAWSNSVFNYSFTRMRDATDITYHIVTVLDLVTNTWPDYWSSATNTYPGSAVSIQQVVTIPTTNQAKSFFRLKVTRP